MKKIVNRFAKDESGATAIEYGLIAALISVVIIGVLSTIGTNLTTKFNADRGPAGLIRGCASRRTETEGLALRFRFALTIRAAQRGDRAAFSISQRFAETSCVSTVGSRHPTGHDDLNTRRHDSASILSSRWR